MSETPASLTIWKSFWEDCPEPCLLCSAEGEPLAWNKAFARHWGPTDPGALARALGEIARETPSRIHIPLPDGRGAACRFFHLTPDPASPVVVLAREQTGHRRPEDAGRRPEVTRRELRAILDHIPALVYVKDTRGRYLFANLLWQEVCRVDAERAIGRDDTELFPAEFARRFMEADRRVMERGESETFDEQAPHPDGTIHDYHSIKAPLRDEHGENYGLCGVSLDITERKRVEQELARAKEAAEAANRTKSLFLAGMSHELRTPLNAILGFARLLRRDPNETPERRESLRIIHKSGEHLLALINDVLDLAKIESGKMRYEPEATDLAALVDDMIVMQRMRAESKGLTLALERPADFPRFVRTDGRKLRQIIINLLGNAIKFTDAGAVTLRLVVLGAGGEAATHLLFEVRDSGPGIAPEDMERIFLPFEQAGINRPPVEGTGLGLAISREYARLLGGDLTAESAPGRGAVFRFTAEVEPAHTRPTRVTASPFPGRVRSIEGARDRRILIVEDVQENRLLLRRQLEPFGFELREAQNGAEALAVAAEWTPDLVILDRRMPVMDGPTCARRLRADPRFAKTRIIALTAHALREEHEEMLSAGCDDSIGKPYRDEELLAAIETRIPVRLVHDTRPTCVEPAPPSPEALRSHLATLPFAALAPLRDALAAADPEGVEHALAASPETLAAIRPWLDRFRFELIAEQLPPEPDDTGL